jgi:hypothetical protein
MSLEEHGFFIYLYGSVTLALEQFKTGEGFLTNTQIYSNLK